jgi:hypothetical protein
MVVRILHASDLQEEPDEIVWQSGTVLVLELSHLLCCCNGPELHALLQPRLPQRDENVHVAKSTHFFAISSSARLISSSLRP